MFKYLFSKYFLRSNTPFCAYLFFLFWIDTPIKKIVTEIIYLLFYFY